MTKKEINKLSRMLTKEQLAWLENYQGVTTFEPMHIEELLDKSISFNEVAKSNLRWFEDWMHETYSDVSTGVPYDPSVG